MPVPSRQFMGGYVAAAALSQGDRHHAEREEARRAEKGVEQAAADVWLSMKKFNGKPDCVRTVSPKV